MSIIRIDIIYKLSVNIKLDFWLGLKRHLFGISTKSVYKFENLTYGGY